MNPPPQGDVSRLRFAPRKIPEPTVRYPPVLFPDQLADKFIFVETCRVCGDDSKEIISLFNPSDEKYDLVNLINKYLPIKVLESDYMPQNVCLPCVNAILSWHELVRSAALADFMIRRRLRSGRPPVRIPRPSTSAGTEVIKDGKKYVDAGTDALEVPGQRQCSSCPLTVPAKRYSTHVAHEHNGLVFRCDECFCYLDKNDLMFHMNQHIFEKLPEEEREAYFANEKANREAEIREQIETDIELRKLREIIHRQRAEELQARKLEKEKMEKRKSKEAASGPGLVEIKVEVEEAVGGGQRARMKSPEQRPRRKSPERDRDQNVPPERNPDVKRSPPKRKRVEPKRSAQAVTSPPKRQKKKRAAKEVPKTSQRTKEPVDRDDENDCEDEEEATDAGRGAETSEKSPKASRTCPICGKQYRASSSYFYHMKYFHKRSREHECAVCNKKFGTKANLAQHASIHTGAYDLECKECGKRFKSKPSLYIHEQSHGGPKRWACGQCGRSFRWRTHLARHVTRHAAERAHVCSTCGRGFSVRCDLLRHARTHAADEYHCATCGLKFAQKRYLQVHVVKKHPEVTPAVVTRS